MAFSNVRSVHLFSTALMAGRWPSADVANPELRASILKRQEVESSVSLSNILGWQSRDTLLDWGGTWIRLAAGSLVMFPAWLRHGVRTYCGRGERISVAINLTAMPLT